MIMIYIYFFLVLVMPKKYVSNFEYIYTHLVVLVSGFDKVICVIIELMYMNEILNCFLAMF